MSNSTNKDSNTAVVDAVSGVIGSLIAMITFYPLDVLKTNIQTSSSSQEKKIIMNKKTENITKIIQKQFQGIDYKIVNTIISNYLFFWVFSWLQYKHKRRYYLKNNNSSNYHLSVVSRLGLTSLAAILNIFVTLPLDVLSTRRQIACNSHCTNDDDDDDNMIVSNDMNTINDIKKKTNRSDYEKTLTDEVFFDCSDEEKKDDIVLQAKQLSSPIQNKHQNNQRIVASNNYSNNNNKIPRPIIQSPIKNNKKAPIESFLSLWSGIGPSIILCSNPAIHYTFYDVMKLYLLQRKRDANENNKLSMNEAFCIGFFAKVLATIVTYPFIRTKVILMAGKHNNDNDIATTNKEQEQSNNNNILQNYNKLIIQSIPFLRILTNMYKDEGIINGLYKGCMIQIIHTALKSAIVMMMKERVSTKVHSILG